MRIAVANIKGGVGKTTIARNLALVLAANNGGSLLAVDADPQESLETFFRDRAERLDRTEITCIKKYGAKGLKREILAVSEPYRDCVIDCGGRDTEALRQVLLASDAVIIPTTCGQESLDALNKMLDVVDDVKAFNDGLKVAVLFNQCPVDAQDTMAPSAAEGVAKQYPEAFILTTRLRHRKTWLKSGISGYAVWEIDGRNKAASEFSDMVNELISLEVI